VVESNVEGLDSFMWANAFSDGSHTTKSRRKNFLLHSVRRDGLLSTHESKPTPRAWIQEESIPSDGGSTQPTYLNKNQTK
jgi:hypothetical protein